MQQRKGPGAWPKALLMSLDLSYHGRRGKGSVCQAGGRREALNAGCAPTAFPFSLPPLHPTPAGACGHPVKAPLGEKPSWLLHSGREVDGREGVFVNSVQRRGACGWVPPGIQCQE